MKLGRRWVGAIITFWLFAAPPLTVEAQSSSLNCRFGLTAPHAVEGYDLKVFGAASYLDWQQTPTKNSPRELSYVHVIRLRGAGRRFVYEGQLQKTFEETLKRDVQNNLRGVWLVGNEPDTNFDIQDAVTPFEYALAYYHIYKLIKSLDPEAQIGIGTIVQPTPLRLSYLDKMIAAYQAQFGTIPPSDFWSIHNFILREKTGEWGAGIPPGLTEVSGELRSLDDTNNVQVFRQRLFTFRQWMNERGQRDKPLWITEYGSLLPHDGRAGLVTQPITQGRDYMLATFDLLLNARDEKIGYPRDDYKLVQRWYWYSLNDELSHFGGSLYDPQTKQRTIIGEAFVDYVSKLEAKPQIKLTSAKLNDRPSEGSFLVRAMLTNYGAAANLKPVTLTALDPLGNALGTSLVLTNSLAGCGSTEYVELKIPKPAGTNGQVFLKLEWEGGTQTIKAGEWKIVEP